MQIANAAHYCSFWKIPLNGIFVNTNLTCSPGKAAGATGTNGLPWLSPEPSLSYTCHNPNWKDGNNRVSLPGALHKCSGKRMNYVSPCDYATLPLGRSRGHFSLNLLKYANAEMLLFGAAGHGL